MTTTADNTVMTMTGNLPYIASKHRPMRMEQSLSLTKNEPIPFRV
jgi:hypothetical protein